MPRAKGWGGHLSLAHTATWSTSCRANSPTHISSGPAHLRLIIRVSSAVLPRITEGPTLSQVLQLGRGRASSLALMTLGHLQQVMSGKQGGDYFSLVYATAPETSDRTRSLTQGWLTSKLLQCVGSFFPVLLLSRGEILSFSHTPQGQLFMIPRIGVGSSA